MILGLEPSHSAPLNRDHPSILIEAAATGSAMALAGSVSSLVTQNVQFLP